MIFQDLLNKNSPKVTQVVNEGQLSVIKPNVAHTMVFSKDTIFLNLVRGEREHNNYGVTHTIKHLFVDDKEKDLLLSSYKFNCRSCENMNLKRVVSLGYQPLANNLLKKKDENIDKLIARLNDKREEDYKLKNIIQSQTQKNLREYHFGEESVDN